MPRIVLISLIVIVCCNNTEKHHSATKVNSLSQVSLMDSNKMVVSERYLCPDSFFRTHYDTNSFEYYLSHLQLKPIDAMVKMYDGTIKYNNNVYSSVVDMEISAVDLQQCADAVMRLRGEYLFTTKQYSKIKFRLLKNGEMLSYLNYTGSDRSYKKFRKYMDYVFSYANTSSLHDQLHAVAFSNIQIGDVFIQKGKPYGHAVIVVDVCKNNKGEKQFILAQSYMPAQETQILQCPYTNSSWYTMTKSPILQTPEWQFDTTDLRRW